jgi:large subunit GTPase 1
MSNQQQGMGKALVRAKKKRQLANRANFQAILEQEQRQHVAQETAPKLQSVWQSTNLDDVLEAAGEREEGFAALRDVRVVVSGAVHVVSGDKMRPQSTASRDWYSLSEKLPIPERPKWNFRQRVDEVQVQEKQAFVEWRRTLARFEEADKVVMTPFEKNVEVWRQLWRVVEKSDIILQIVDARNPLAFRSAGLERYVARHNTRAGKPKQCIMLLNKSDLLTDNQRKAWARYFESKGIRFFFFSARASTEAQEAAAAEANALHAHPATDLEGQLAEAAAEAALENEDSDEESDEEEEASKPATQPARRGAPDGTSRGHVAGGASASMLESERFQAEVMRRERELAEQAANTQRKERRRKDRKVSGAPTKVDNPYAMKSLKDEMEDRRLKREAERALEKPRTQDEIERDLRLAQDMKERFQPWDVLDPVTLLDALAVMRDDLGVSNNSDPVMVGMCGYPNVGKSSTINAIMQCKKVVVSATPGKTKHFQTLPIPNERRLQLCDCPGLVFPSFASTKEAMVCDGVLPVDTCRDYLAAVSVVCERVPRGVFERMYTILLEKDFDVDVSASRGEFLLNQLSRRKGFMTEHDKPNRYRSAHIVLKDYVDGKIVFAHPPPGLVLEDPDPPENYAKPSTVTKNKKPSKAKPAAAGKVAPAADEGWETASDDDDGEEGEGEWETDDENAGEWEDIDDIEGQRALSDADADSEVEDEGPEPLTFYSNTVPGQRTRMNTAEVFNIERNQSILGAPTDAQRPKKKKINHMLVPDESYRVNRHGEKELLLDDDDDIVICDEREVKPKELSKKQRRRAEKRGYIAARGAKPAAISSVYDVRPEMLVETAPTAIF